MRLLAARWDAAVWLDWPYVAATIQRRVQGFSSQPYLEGVTLGRIKPIGTSWLWRTGEVDCSSDSRPTIAHNF
jgi:hypothetical protein